MGCFTAGGNPIRKGRFSQHRGPGLSAAPAGRPTMKVTSTDCVAIASMRGAFSRFNSPTRWRPVRCVGFTRRILNEKVSFFTSYLYHVNAGGLVFDFVFFTVCCSLVMMVTSIPSFLTDCCLIIDMGMPHLNGLGRERLACLLARSRFVRDMPHRSDLTA